MRQAPVAIERRSSWRALRIKGRACATCEHLSAALSCLEPIKARLIDPDAGFGIALVARLDGKRCPAWLDWTTGRPLLAGVATRAQAGDARRCESGAARGGGGLARTPGVL